MRAILRQFFRGKNKTKNIVSRPQVGVPYATLDQIRFCVLTKIDATTSGDNVPNFLGGFGSKFESFLILHISVETPDRSQTPTEKKGQFFVPV